MDINKLIEEITQEVVKDLTKKGITDFSKCATAAPAGNAGYDPSYAKYCDHTVLKADTTRATVERFCREAKEYGFASVCINPTHVKFVSGLLKGSGVKTCCVIGFPLGANTPLVKAVETRDAIANGAEEVDMVINIGALKDGNDELVAQDIQAVVDAAKGKALIKVIIECSALTDDEKVRACLMAKRAGADFVKTSTGMGSGGAKVEDVRLMKKTVGDMLVKASTGVKTRADADAFLAAGAVRFGTSSGMDIVKGSSAQQNKNCINCGQCKDIKCPTGNATVISNSY